jgi:branched-chain amino acid transport system ATP-binding protein
MALSDEVIVLDYGELIATGTPEEVVQNQQVIEAYLGDPKIAQRLLSQESLE